MNMMKKDENQFNIINDYTLFFLLNNTKNINIKEVYKTINMQCNTIEDNNKKNDENKIHHYIFEETFKKLNCQIIYMNDIKDYMNDIKDYMNDIKDYMNEGHNNKEIYNKEKIIIIGVFDTKESITRHAISIIIDTFINKNEKYISNIYIQNSGYFSDTIGDIKTKYPAVNYVYKIPVTNMQKFEISIGYILQIINNNKILSDFYYKQDLFIQN